jgi:hypothetical protein
VKALTIPYHTNIRAEELYYEIGVVMRTFYSCGIEVLQTKTEEPDEECIYTLE